MSVRQLKENKITKDGRSWVFIQYSKGLDGKRHQYQSPAYYTKKEETLNTYTHLYESTLTTVTNLINQLPNKKD